MLKIKFLRANIQVLNCYCKILEIHLIGLIQLFKESPTHRTIRMIRREYVIDVSSPSFKATDYSQIFYDDVSSTQISINPLKSPVKANPNPELREIKIINVSF